MADAEKKSEGEEQGLEKRTGDAEEEEEEDDEDHFVAAKKVSLKEQLEMDKEDESLRRWKEQLLGDLSLEDGGKAEAEVQFLAMRLLVEGREPLNLPLPPQGGAPPADGSGKGSKGSKGPLMHFVLKEMSVYRIQFEFSVRNELVLGLTYANRVYRLRALVDRRKLMLGTYGPQKEPYKFETEEETTPHGILARGKYTAKTAFVDDDGRTYLEFDYTFEIKKDW